MLLYLRPLRAPPLRYAARRFTSSSSHVSAASTVRIAGRDYPTDEMMNLPESINAKIPLQLHRKPGHPIATLRGLVESHYPDFAHLTSLSPLVTPYKNFDELGFPADHPGRARSDSYYINKNLMLRTHTSAHEVETFTKGEDKWLLTADVYRRDEIDASHYPVFHQMEGARIFGADARSMEALYEENKWWESQLARTDIVIEDVPHVSSTNPVQETHDAEHAALVAANLKYTLNGLMFKLFGADSKRESPLRVRWIEAYFPFTSPSFEVEVFFGGKWLEILGCGVVKQRTLDMSSMLILLISSSFSLLSIILTSILDVPNKIGWAFGLGLERIAMILYSIPDIRLFWSEDPRFLSQFEPGKITKFKPYSKYPAAPRDISFWMPQHGEPVHPNDFCDTVRDIAGDLAQDVKQVCLA
jgi:phenylalanyl-tRNA synthetase alpha chain